MPAWEQKKEKHPARETRVSYGPNVPSMDQYGIKKKEGWLGRYILNRLIFMPAEI